MDIVFDVRSTGQIMSADVAAAGRAEAWLREAVESAWKLVSGARHSFLRRVEIAAGAEHWRVTPTWGPDGLSLLVDLGSMRLPDPTPQREDHYARLRGALASDLARLADMLDPAFGFSSVRDPSVPMHELEALWRIYSMGRAASIGHGSFDESEVLDEFQEELGPPLTRPIFSSLWSGRPHSFGELRTLARQLAAGRTREQHVAAYLSLRQHHHLEAFKKTRHAIRLLLEKLPEDVLWRVVYGSPTVQVRGGVPGPCTVRVRVRAASGDDPHLILVPLRLDAEAQVSSEMVSGLLAHELGHVMLGSEHSLGEDGEAAADAKAKEWGFAKELADQLRWDVTHDPELATRPDRVSAVMVRIGVLEA